MWRLRVWERREEWERSRGKGEQCPGDGMGVAITERNEVERGGVLGLP